MQPIHIFTYLSNEEIYVIFKLDSITNLINEYEESHGDLTDLHNRHDLTTGPHQSYVFLVRLIKNSLLPFRTDVGHCFSCPIIQLR